MKNIDVLKSWKGGNADDVLTFDSPFDYEDCLLGISTDGRAIYDFYECADFYVDNNSELEEGEELSDDDDHEMRMEWASMVDRDYRFMDQQSKFPLFLMDDDVSEDETNRIESKYDFSECIIGKTFHFETPVYSVKDMINVIKKTDNCSWKEAKNIIYSLTEAGNWKSEDELNYIILDDEKEGFYFRDVTKSQLYMTYKVKESIIDKADNNTECVLSFKLSDVKDFLSNVGCEDYHNRVFLNCVNLREYKDKKDGQNKVLFEFTNGLFAVQKYTDIVIKPGLSFPRYALDLDIVKYLGKYEEDAELKILQRENDDTVTYFLKIGEDELAKSVPKGQAQYVEVDRIIPAELPNSITINRTELFDCVKQIQPSDICELKIDDNVLKIFSQNGTLLKEIKADVKGAKINLKFISQHLYRLCKYAPEENIILQYADEVKPVKMAQKDILLVFMTYKK